ncbi:MAG: multicopper oxidase domain-containing protein [Nitrospinae bacterium]|nr:multicopper oxidase domain-containing protein [Nitrospinota bacterium]
MDFFKKVALAAVAVAVFGAAPAMAKTVKVSMKSVETEWQYDNDGNKMLAFTFDGTIPGPVVRATEGDTVEFTLTNDKNNKMSHAMDFHAARVNVLNEFAPIKPGETKTFSFPATYPGVFFYHCGAMPMQEHIGRGMFGVIIIDPKKDTRPKADREYVLVQSEIYKDPTTLQGPFETTVFNGRKFRYDPVHDPKASGNVLIAKPGERVRVYFANAGPNDFSAFHPIAGIWDAVYLSGNPKNVQHGVQTFVVGPGDASTFDLISPVEGGNAIVTHTMRGALTGGIAVIVFKNKLTAAEEKLGKSGNLIVP